MRKGKEKKTEPWGLFVNAAVGSVLALGLTLILLFVASILVVSGRLPEGSMGAVTVGVLFLASLTGAIVAIRRNLARVLLAGVLQGLILYGITFIGGAFAEVPSLFGDLSLLLFLASILGGVTAGVFWVRPKKRKI